MGFHSVGSLYGGFSVVGCSLPPADPYTKQALFQIGRDYGYGREHPEDRFGPMNRIKVVNWATDESQAARVRNTYRFLPHQHTDFLLGGLDASAVEAMFLGGAA